MWVLHVTQQGLPVTQHNVTGYAGSDYHPRRCGLQVTQAEVTGYTVTGYSVPYRDGVVPKMEPTSPP